jgi:hypothetical protein
MAATGTLLMLSGITCLGLFIFAVRTLMPRAGRQPSAWIAGETRSTVVTLALLVFFVFGVGLFVRGVFA